MAIEQLKIGAFLFLLVLSQFFVEPAYIGYAIAFALMGSTRIFLRDSLRWIWYPKPGWLVALLMAIVLAAVSWGHAPSGRDVLRDMGVISAFFVGAYWMVRFQRLSDIKMLLEALSKAGVWVAIITLAGAAAAFAAGVDAYQWRGKYVPYAHTWLPYFVAANYALITSATGSSRAHVRRLTLCVVATFASLSRTDILLDLVFLGSIGLVHSQSFFSSRKVRARLAFVMLAVIMLLPPFLNLDVVQQRVETGIDEGDSSVGWRLTEDLAFLDYMSQATPAEWLLGFGLGARLPLPDGILDVDGNDSIPHLHNSLLTIVLKCGVLGIVGFLVLLGRLWWATSGRVPAEMGSVRSAGRWLVFFVLGKAVTLQGLTEWSHVLIFGVGIMILTFVRREKAMVRTVGVEVGDAGAIPAGAGFAR